MFEIRITAPFPASRLGKPCYLGLLRNGSRFMEIETEKNRPAFLPTAIILDRAIMNTEQIFFEELHYDEGMEGIYTITHIAFYEKPHGGEAFLAIPVKDAFYAPTGAVVVIEPGMLFLPIARGI